MSGEMLKMSEHLKQRQNYLEVNKFSDKFTFKVYGNQQTSGQEVEQIILHEF